MKSVQIPDEELVQTYAKLIDSADKEVILMSDNLGEFSHPEIREAVRKKSKPSIFFDQHYKNGEELASRGKYKEAIDEWEKVRELLERFEHQPEFSKMLGVLYNNLGFCYLNTNDNQRAKICLESSLFFDPNAVFVNNNMGDLHKKIGQNDSAIAFYEKELAINPQHPTARESIKQPRQYGKA
jgi:tetratricopeptide (TPR) repeat protein